MIVVGHVLPDPRHAGATASRMGLVEQLHAAGSGPVLAPDVERFAETLRAVPDVDVVVNTEGTVHHGAGDAYARCVRLAKEDGRHVRVTNAVLQGLTEGQVRDLAFADVIEVRETGSLRECRKVGLEATLVPDSIHAATWAKPTHYTRRLDGCVVIGCGHEHVVGRTFERLHERIPGSARYTMTEAAPEWRHLVPNLRRCRLYVTGRYHALLACWIAGCPVVVLNGANTSKLHDQLETVGSRCRVYELDEALAAVEAGVSAAWAEWCRADAARWLAAT